jgi:hypothetical protein
MRKGNHRKTDEREFSILPPVVLGAQTTSPEQLLSDLKELTERVEILDEKVREIANERKN